MISASGNIFTYNAENRLVSINPESPVDGNTKLEFVYDYMGRRVKKTVSTYSSGAWDSGTATLFVYDGWNLIQELDESETVQKTYVWGLDLSQSMQGAGGIGGLIASVDVADDAMYFYAYDANGNVGQVVDASGSLKARYEYDPFGNTLVAEGDYADENAFRFSTKYFDSESSLYYYGYRYYSAEMGRWVSRDPTEEKGGMNLYGFIGNDVVNKGDYLGYVDYDIDSQGFHIRLDTKSNITFKVDIDNNGNYKITEKAGHPLTRAQKKKAEEAFKKLIQNPEEQRKMRDAIAKKFPTFQNKNFVKASGKNLRKLISKVKVGNCIFTVAVAGYVIVSSKEPVKEVGVMAVQAGGTAVVGAAGVYMTGGTITATFSSVTAASGVGTLIVGTFAIGYKLGEGLNGLSEKINDELYHNAVEDGSLNSDFISSILWKPDE